MNHWQRKTILNEMLYGDFYEFSRKNLNLKQKNRGYGIFNILTALFLKNNCFHIELNKKPKT